MSYADFIAGKLKLPGGDGFEPLWMPDCLYEFQQYLVEWTLREGCGANLIDCGLGKSPIQLTVAQNIVLHTNRPVLIATPLAVSYQLLREAEKFGIPAVRCIDGNPGTGARVVITNFQRLHYFSARDYAAIEIDEASILKNVIGKLRRLIQRMMNQVRYRSLYSGTAAPNAFIELGTFSEALGRLREDQMKERFFRQVDQPTIARWSKGQRHSGRGDMHSKGWRFRGHAEEPFWKWVSSWSRSARLPGHLGFPEEDFRYDLPELIRNQHIVEPEKVPDGLLFHVEARGLREQRGERRATMHGRCDKAAELVDHQEQAIVWCELNPEGERLVEVIPDGVEVAGSAVRFGSAVTWRPAKGADLDTQKEETILAFERGEIRVLISKPKICAWGLNLQSCHRMVFLGAMNSFEGWYQAVRRCWRFGQLCPVTVDLITTPGESRVLINLREKQTRADYMFERLVAHM
ncbi:MAG TPA: DEAD/DEAH box helicase, partial [Armatimonadota bacterium]|nr:DEAD/DEAH box helicase [Armatimonadota bacterium]